MAGQEVYINEQDFGVHRSPFQDTFDDIDFISPPAPHTPSYNGSYQNSPFSGHSELSLHPDDQFADFDFPTNSHTANEYNPGEFEISSNSLLMFSESDYMLEYDPNNQPTLSVSHVEHRGHTPFDYSSPSSNDSGQEGSRSRGSSVSSGGGHHASPRLDVVNTFENMSFQSPHWGVNPLPSIERVSPPLPKPMSPPILRIPDSTSSTTAASFPQPPTIIAPSGDGGMVSGPQLHIVPATPVSGATGPARSVPFQNSTDTVHQHVIPPQPSQRQWDDAQALELGSSDSSMQYNAPHRFDFSSHSHMDRQSTGLSTANAQIGRNEEFFNQLNSRDNNRDTDNRHYSAAARHRRKSDTSLDTPWSTPILPAAHHHLLDESALDEGTVNMNDVLAPSSASPRSSSFTHQPHLNHNYTFGPPSSQHTSHFLSPDNVSVRRSKSDASTSSRPGHRQSRSEHISGSSSPYLFPPTTQGQYLSPLTHPSSYSNSEDVQSIRGHHRRASSGSRNERGMNGASWGGSSGGSSVRASPYPSPNVSPRVRYDELPNELAVNGLDISSNGHTSAPVVGKANVTTIRTAQASKTRRKQDANFTCPIPGCGSTFTRSFNLKGHIRSHNEEKPFQCHWPGCGKGFARQHDCKRHENLHSNFRPYSCEGCQKPFARMDALNRHLRSEGGAECQRMLTLSGATMPLVDGGPHSSRVPASSPAGGAKLRLSPPTKSEEGAWPSLGVAT